MRDSPVISRERSKNDRNSPDLRMYKAELSGPQIDILKDKDTEQLDQNSISKKFNQIDERISRFEKDSESRRHVSTLMKNSKRKSCYSPEN